MAVATAPIFCVYCKDAHPVPGRNNDDFHAVLVSVETGVVDKSDIVKAALGAIIEYAQLEMRKELQRAPVDSAGVCFGSGCSDFMHLFNEYRARPLTAALGHIERFGEEVNGKPFWRTFYKNPDYALVEHLWEEAQGEIDIGQTTGYHFVRAVLLAAGLYLPESGFFSVPDRSTAVSVETFRWVKYKPEDFALVFFRVDV